MTTVEERRLAIQEELDGCKSAQERNKLGQFATPPRLAREIVRDAVRLLPKHSDPIRIIEPSCGTGSFISAITECPGLSDAQITGVELDSVFADAAKGLWTGQATVVTNDFLNWSTEGGKRFDLLVANPPYVRHHHLSQEQKARYGRVASEASGFALSGLAGLYAYFVLAATDCLANEAVATWLIPTEFMSVNYGSALRSYLAEKVTLERIHIFQADDLQFDDALVTSCVVTYTNRRPSHNHEALFTFGSSLATPSETRRVPLCRLRSSAKWLKCLETRSDSQHQVSLGELFTIRRGIATGANDFFIKPRDEFHRLGITDEYLKPVLPSPRYMPLSEVDVDAQGWPVGTGSYALLDCTGVSEHNLPDPVTAYLNSADAKVRSSYLIRGRMPWYSQEQRPAAPILCTYMGRSSAKSDSAFRFIRNRSRATATNSYLMLFLKPEIAQSSTREWLDEVWKRLSTLTPESLMSEGREYGGGLKKIEPRELARVPVPDLERPSMEPALF